MVLSAASIIIQYHIFLAFALVVAALLGLAIRALVKRKWLPPFLDAPEYLIIAVLVVIYVFANV
ncbi:hypothetical protein Dform_00980 [Dehalogenimonas formicexedens]|uniref:DUF1656 domain-containing protein n=1 Tax=Dehalogenimonas formicexedens TaxID=1839801 RepID=A0A1P8F771_9CHLR|nr:hypothetical protein [Dehalogenimonas formicexedens]APV44321.1 hypothetical protein Dform_00980 [Dehalogenimonas formicexedens]